MISILLIAFYSGAMNTIMFGGIAWALLKGHYEYWSRFFIALSIPVLFNLLIILFKSDLTMLERVAGFGGTLFVIVCSAVWMRASVAKVGNQNG